MTIPRLVDLQSQIRQDLEQELGIGSVMFKRSINAFAAVQAGKLHLYYQAIAKLQKNIFVDTADREADGGTLERFGRVKIERNPRPATQGTFDITVNGVAGGVIAQGLTFRNPINSAIYAVQSSVTLTGTTGVVRVTSFDSGEIIALNIGDELTSTSPIVNVRANASVLAIISAPLNEEDIEAYRQLVLQAYRSEPQGGSAGDYRIWASDAAGVLRVYPYVGSLAGVINIFVEASGDDKIPNQALLNTVRDVVNFDPDTTKPDNDRGRRPISAWEVNYLSVVLINVNVTITGLSDSSASVISAINSGLTQYLENIRPFVAGSDDPNSINDTIRNSDVTRIITQTIASNNFFDTISLNVNGGDVSSFRFLQGNIPNLANLDTP